MAKDTLWFPHDYNARADEKTAALINDHGAAGYGVFQIITEMLHEEESSKIQYDDKKLRRLAASCKISFEQFKSIIDDCIHIYELWIVADGYFFSDRVIRNKEDREALRQKKIAAGKLGGEAYAQNLRANAQKKQSTARAKRSKAEQTRPQDKTGHNITTLASDEAKELSNESSDIAAQKFSKFQDWITKHASQVEKMKEPFTCDQFVKIRNEYSLELIQEVLTAMHNKKTLCKDYTSAYLTFLNWAKRRLDQVGHTDKPAGQTVSETDNILKKLIDGSQH